MKPRKLVYVLNHYSKNSPAHFNHIFGLLEEITKLQIDVILIIEKADDIPNIRNTRIELKVQRQKIVLFRFIELVFLIFLARRKGYKHVFIRISRFAALSLISFNLFSDIKVYFWLSGQGFMENYSEKSGISRFKDYFINIFPYRLIVKGVTKFVTGPESMGDYFHNFCGVPKEKILILYNDIDPNRFFPMDLLDKIKLQKDLNINSYGKVILFAHRFSPVRKTPKYFTGIIKVLEEIEIDFKVYFLGSGPDEQAVKDMCQATFISDKFVFLGNVPNNCIQSYYQAADIFINPTFSEGFPRVLLEAMACGLPLITTDAGGIRDILGENQKEYMTEKEDYGQFSEKLKELLVSDLDQKKVAIENLESVKRFYTPGVAKMYVEKLMYNND
jgi:glycosyltransferase involved in cell wall biosynthesis